MMRDGTVVTEISIIDTTIKTVSIPYVRDGLVFLDDMIEIVVTVVRDPCHIARIGDRKYVPPTVESLAYGGLESRWNGRRNLHQTLPPSRDIDDLRGLSGAT